MKKNDKHEKYCACRDCKCPEQALPLLEKPKEPEKRDPPKEPLNPPHAMGG